MSIKTEITEGIKITVATQYRPDLSQVSETSYFYNYKIEIHNSNPATVQLLHRDWFIYDSLNNDQHVSGEGVIGEQPILKHGEKYDFVSGCELKSEIGFMKGYYTFKNLESGMIFQVFIPTFNLIYPHRMN